MSVALSSGVRTALFALQGQTSQIEDQQFKLATGRKVNSAIDNPAAFFVSQGLSARAGDLSRLQDDVGQALKTLEAADNGIKALTKLVESAQGIARQARQSSDATVRADLATQFGGIRTQIDQLITDTGYNGVNLLNGDDLQVVFNESSTSTLTLTGVTFDSAGLTISAAAGSWATNANVDAALTELSDAVTTLRSQAATFGANLAVVKTRQEFTRAAINTLQSGSDQLVLADANEEGAKLVTLQTRQQLSSTALGLATQADQNVLRLFR
jgi:flagellin-like hook-associated protein FlgL